MRDSLTCPKCKQFKILFIDRVPDTGEFVSEVRDLHIAVTSTGEGWLGEKLGRAGKLSAVVCKTCGYTELYTSNPGQIPVDGKYVREEVGPRTGLSPYRE